MKEKNLAAYPYLNGTLADLARLQQKTLKTASEKKEFLTLFGDAVFKDLKEYLATPETQFDIEVNRQHQLAASLLQEGLTANKEAAIEAALHIVKEDTLEDDNLNKNARLLMAKDKAEIIYHFVALAPKFEKQFLAGVPGPVTQNIYSNMKETQKQNLQASASEVAAFEAKHKSKR